MSRMYVDRNVRLEIDDEGIDTSIPRRTVRITDKYRERYVAESFEHPAKSHPGHDEILQRLTEHAIGRCTYRLLVDTGAAKP